MDVKTIKGVDDETWMKFKVLAAKKRLTMGRLLGDMIDSYDKHAEETWEKILNSGKILSDKEAEELERDVKKIRKAKWFRV